MVPSDPAEARQHHAHATGIRHPHSMHCAVTGRAGSCALDANSGAVIRFENTVECLGHRCCKLMPLLLLPLGLLPWLLDARDNAKDAAATVAAALRGGVEPQRCNAARRKAAASEVAAHTKIVQRVPQQLAAPPC